MLKRVTEAQVTADLKTQVEREVLERYCALRQPRPQQGLPPQQRPQAPQKPSLPIQQDGQRDVVQQLDELSVREVPRGHSAHGRPKTQDIYSTITKMNAQLALEDDTRRKKEIKTKQHVYREELDQQLREKQKTRN